MLLDDYIEAYRKGLAIITEKNVEDALNTIDNRKKSKKLNEYNDFTVETPGIKITQGNFPSVYKHFLKTQASNPNLNNDDIAQMIGDEMGIDCAQFNEILNKIRNMNDKERYELKLRAKKSPDFTALDEVYESLITENINKHRYHRRIFNRLFN